MPCRCCRAFTRCRRRSRLLPARQNMLRIRRRNRKRGGRQTRGKTRAAEACRLRERLVTMAGRQAVSYARRRNLRQRTAMRGCRYACEYGARMGRVSVVNECIATAFIAALVSARYDTVTRATPYDTLLPSHDMR